MITFVMRGKINPWVRVTLTLTQKLSYNTQVVLLPWAMKKELEKLKTLHKKQLAFSWNLTSSIERSPHHQAAGWEPAEWPAEGQRACSWRLTWRLRWTHDDQRDQSHSNKENLSRSWLWKAGKHSSAISSRSTVSSAQSSGDRWRKISLHNTTRPEEEPEDQPAKQEELADQPSEQEQQE